MKHSLWKSLKRAASRWRRKQREKGLHNPPSYLDGVLERFRAEMREKPQHGPDWEMNVHHETFLYVYKGELELWLQAELEMPSLRHVDGTLVRSDGRETMAAVLLASACAMDLVTCNVGTPEPDEKGRPYHWKGRSLTFIERVTGKSYDACKNAMQGFYERGGMSRFPLFDVDADYEIHNRASVRHFYPDFFRGMGDKVWEALQEAQDTLYNAASEAKEKVIETGAALGRMAVRAAEAVRNKGRKLGPGERSKENDDLVASVRAKLTPPYLRPKAAPT